MPGTPIPPMPPPGPTHSPDTAADATTVRGDACTAVRRATRRLPHTAPTGEWAAQRADVDSRPATTRTPAPRQQGAMGTYRRGGRRLRRRYRRAGHLVSGQARRLVDIAVDDLQLGDDRAHGNDEADPPNHDHQREPAVVRFQADGAAACRLRQRRVPGRAPAVHRRPRHGGLWPDIHTGRTATSTSRSRRTPSCSSVRAAASTRRPPGTTPIRPTRSRAASRAVPTTTGRIWCGARTRIFCSPTRSLRTWMTCTNGG